MIKFGKNHIRGGKGESRNQNIKSYSTGLNIPRSLRERSKYIPLRLSMDERRYLRLLESILSVSDYTGDVDRTFKNSSERSHRVLKQVRSSTGRGVCYCWKQQHCFFVCVRLSFSLAAD